MNLCPHVIEIINIDVKIAHSFHLTHQLDGKIIKSLNIYLQFNLKDIVI